ncbi:MAG: hypothetical protein GY774_02450 [Planctomycetes bacterium]|nr:hypothetical protein [Planctomycetota bacterium]
MEISLPDEGHEIEIRDELPVSHRRAHVRWINEVDDDYYRVGLQFTEDIKEDRR